MYQMQPVDESHTRPDWMIELEVGSGIARNFATITDLAQSKAPPNT
jgi:hypothetical protein